MQHVLILGIGESGLAMARWARHVGARVRIADTRTNAQHPPPMLAQLRAELPEVDVRLQAFTSDLLEGITHLGVSPGLSPLAPEMKAFLHAAWQASIPIESEIEWFARALADLKHSQNYQPKLLAITGTNGKTTVTSLTTHLCQAAGKSAVACGNISPSALDALLDAIKHQTLPEVWVLELSSFQLHYTQSLQADAAALLNITQDHLDWHGDMAHYAAAKAKIFAQNTVRVLNHDDPLCAVYLNSKTVSISAREPEFAGSFGLARENGMVWLATAVAEENVKRLKKGELAATFTKLLMPADALQIRGLHNATNALTALALCQAIGLPLASTLHAVRDYRGEAHRVELIDTIRGVAFYDDSKGTNVGATVAALQGLGGELNNREKIILLAGGVGKGQDFAPLAPMVARYCKQVMVFGESENEIQQALNQTGIDIKRVDSLPAAVQHAAQQATAGDAVLLSPACASFDMFKNYAHRAEVFCSAVQAWAEEAGEVRA